MSLIRKLRSIVEKLLEENRFEENNVGYLHDPKIRNILDYISKNAVKIWRITNIKFRHPNDKYTSIAYLIKLNNPEYPYATVWFTDSWNYPFSLYTHINFTKTNSFITPPISDALSHILSYINELDIIEEKKKRHRGRYRKELEKIEKTIEETKDILEDIDEKILNKQLTEEEAEKLLDKYFETTKEITY